jgi:IBR domain, a half RING-finger domain
MNTNEDQIAIDEALILLNMQLEELRDAVSSLQDEDPDNEQIDIWNIEINEYEERRRTLLELRDVPSEGGLPPGPDGAGGNRLPAARGTNARQAIDLTHIDDEDRAAEQENVAQANINPLALLIAELEQPTLRECIVCSEEFETTELVTLRYRHAYCHGCLKTTFIRATGNESEFPPKCCNHLIPQARLEEKRLWTYKERSAFQTAKVEYSTVNRTYCSNANCAKFIKPKVIDATQGDFVRCRSCRRMTCKRCKNAHDTILECPARDQATIDFGNLARQNGWRECGQCHAMVELNVGCYHIT